MSGVIVRARFRPRAPADGAVVELRVCGGSGVRADFEGQQWWPLIVPGGMPVLKARLGWDGQRFDGGAVTTVGQMQIADSDGRLEPYKGLVWKGATAEIWTAPLKQRNGVELTADGDFSLLWQGLADDLKVEGQLCTIVLADAGEKLRVPVLEQEYDGAGDLGGIAERKGGKIGRGWGRCPSVKGRLIDAAYWIYDFGITPDGAATIHAVRDGGYGLAVQTAAASLAALRALVIDAGKVATCVVSSRVLVRWWTKPKFLPSADITFGATTKPAEIAASLLAARAPAVTFAAGQVAAYNAVQSASCGRYVDPDADTGMTVEGLLDWLFGGLGSWWQLGAAGTLEIGRYGEGGTAYTVDEARVIAVDRQGVIMPVSRRSLGYQPNAAIHNDGDIAASITAGDVDGLGVLAAQDNVTWSTQVTGAGKPADNATVGATVGTDLVGSSGQVLPDVAVLNDSEIYETWSAYANAAQIAWTNHSGGGAATLISAPSAGGRAIRIGDNAGDDQWWGICDRSIPYDGTSLYEVTIEIEREAGSGGSIYLGLAGRLENGALCNTAGSASHGAQHFVAGGATPPAVADGTIVTYRGYVRGWAATGTATACVTPAAAGKMHTNVRRISPLVLVNYAGQPGIYVIHSVRLRRVVDDPVLAGGLNLDGTLRQNLPSAIGATQDTGVIRNLGKGLSIVRLNDGDVYTFPTAWGSGLVPSVVALQSGYLSSTEYLDCRALSVSASGFTAYCKRVTAASPTPVTETTLVAASAPRVAEISKGTAAEAYDDTYTFQIDVTITNQALGGGEYNAGRVTVGFWTYDGATWVLHTTRTYYGAGNAATTARLNQVVSVSRDGMGSGDRFGVSVESTLYGGGVSSFDNVKYGTASGQTINSATPSGYPGIDFLIFAGAE